LLGILVLGCPCTSYTSWLRLRFRMSGFVHSLPTTHIYGGVIEPIDTFYYLYETVTLETLVLDGK